MPKSKKVRQRADMYVYLSSILWAFFPIVTILTFSTLDPLPSLALSTLFATLFFAVLMTQRKKWHELRNTTALRDILYVTAFIGIGYYILTFMALKYTSAGNVTLIALLEILSSYIFFSVLRKEDFPIRNILGSVLMVAGAVIVLLPNARAFNIGDFLVMFGVLLAPIGNFFQRRARMKVSSETIMFVRSGLTTVIVFTLAYVLGQRFALADVSGSLVFLLINGVLLFGITKMLWIEAIHRESVTRATALSSVTPALTLLLAFIILGQHPTMFQIISFVPLVGGLYFLET